jgi:hypothetical protein
MTIWASGAREASAHRPCGVDMSYEPLAIHPGCEQRQRVLAMTTSIYIRARDPENGARVVEDMLALGLPPERLKVYGKRIPEGLRVQAIRWHRGILSIVLAAIAGAIAFAVVGAVLLIGIDAETAELLALVGAGTGAFWQQSRLSRRYAAVSAQKDALRHGDMMIVADVDNAELEWVETQVAESHPEVLLLGTDPGGVPPFP